MSTIRGLLLALPPAVLLALGADARAQTVTGEIQLISAPPSVVAGQLVSPNTMAFAESTGITLSSPLMVDHTMPGVHVGPSSPPAVIPVGTVVSSFFLHLDPGGITECADGSITFAEPILGIIVDEGILNATDGLLGAPGVQYDTGGRLRGFEVGGGFHPDTVTISADRRTLTFSQPSATMCAATAVDQLRVVLPHDSCQPDLGFAGPGNASATLCGTGLAAGESSDYRVDGAAAGAPGALLLSAPNMTNVTLFPMANPGVMVSGAGLALALPIAADANGQISITVHGLGVAADLVFQSLFADGTVLPHNVAFTNAVLAQFGQ